MADITFSDAERVLAGARDKRKKPPPMSAEHPPSDDDAAAIAASTEAPMVYREQEMDLAVTRREVVTSNVVALTLADPAGGTVPGWTPGGHIDLVLDETFTRQYSLCGPLRDRTSFRIAVLRAADGGGSGLSTTR